MVELHPDNVVSRIRLAEGASQAGRTEEAIREFGQASDQLKMEGRADEYVRVAERLLFHRPDNFAVARDLAAAYIARKNPRLALAKLQGALKAAPRDPQNVTLLAEAMVELESRKAIPVWRELAEIHAEAHREDARDAAVRAALALDPTDGETREMAARWAVARRGGGARSLATAQGSLGDDLLGRDQRTGGAARVRAARSVRHAFGHRLGDVAGDVATWGLWRLRADAVEPRGAHPVGGRRLREVRPRRAGRRSPAPDCRARAGAPRSARAAGRRPGPDRTKARGRGGAGHAGGAAACGRR